MSVQPTHILSLAELDRAQLPAPVDAARRSSRERAARDRREAIDADPLVGLDKATAGLRAEGIWRG
jgi:hypothetical protein